jgi:predicted Zn finger-like uncharacterized protein
MIAACPECRTQYRVDPQRLTSEGVRLRCTRCQTVFRVRAAQPSAPAPSARPAAEARPAPRPAPSPARPSAPPPAREVAQPPPITREAAPPPARDWTPPPAPAPAASGSNALSERLVLVATPDADKAKDWSEALRGWGLEAETAHDGVEALLKIHRRWPSAVVMDPQLPKMFGFQVCEVIKRNESLRRIGVVLIGAIHHPERYRRSPTELYGADAYVEEPDLPEALAPILRDLGLPLGPGSRPSRPAAPPAPRFPAGEPTLPPAPRFPAGEATLPPAPRFPAGEATMPPVPPEATLPPRPPPRPLAPPPLPEPLAAVEDALEPAPEAEPTLPPVEVLREPEPVAPPPRRAPAPPPHPAPAPPPRRAAPAPLPAVEIAPEPAPAIGSPEFDVIDPDAAPADPPLPPAPAPRAPAARSAPAVDPEVEKAERLARIIVSDVVLYNEEKFRAACAAGNVMEVLEADLADGRAHFAARVPERVRQARDFLGDELLRVARSRGMA